MRHAAGKIVRNHSCPVRERAYNRHPPVAEIARGIMGVTRERDCTIIIFYRGRAGHTGLTCKNNNRK